MKYIVKTTDIGGSAWASVGFRHGSDNNWKRLAWTEADAKRFSTRAAAERCAAAMSLVREFTVEEVSA